MNILIVGTVRPSHESLLTPENNVVLFMPQDKAVPEDLSQRYAHTVLLNKDAGASLWCQVAGAIHADVSFDCVVCFTDVYQQLASDIARHLGVRCNVEAAVLHATSNKHAMRDALARAGVASCRHRQVDSEAALRQAVSDIGLPCIVKPVAGQASMHVVKLEDAADMGPAVDSLGHQTIAQGMVVEEYMSGKEYSVESISAAGRHYIVAITEKFKDAATFVEVGHVVPAPLDDAQASRIRAYVIEALTALGFHDGPSHTELIVTAEGPRIVETHTRLAGDRIIELVRHATGIDLYALSALQAIGKPVAAMLDRHVTFQQSAAIWYADPGIPETLVLKSVQGVEHALQAPGVQAVDVLKKIGSRGSMVRHSHDRSAFAIATGADQAEALQRARGAVAQIVFGYAAAELNS